MNLKKPAGNLEIVTLVLDCLGICFLLLGLLGTAVPIPMRSGESWMFAVMGLVLLFAAFPCLLLVRARARRNHELRRLGRPVPGRVIRVRHHIWTSLGSRGLRRRHPWTVLCEYRWEGQTYTAGSIFLWERPLETGQAPKIFLDQDNPRRAFVDPDSLKYEIND